MEYSILGSRVAEQYLDHLYYYYYMYICISHINSFAGEKRPKMCVFKLLVDIFPFRLNVLYIFKIASSRFLLRTIDSLSKGASTLFGK